jgi:hypothetical protein
LFLINAKVPALNDPTSKAGVDGELEVTEALIIAIMFNG